MERFAILSDIHSNIFALKAVVNNATSRGAISFINLGDILYGPIAPKETYNFLQNHKFITISGNQDRQICEATQAEINSNSTMQFIINDLENSSLFWMKELPYNLQINDDIYACHGTPKDDMIYLLEDIKSGSPRVRSDSEILTLLEGIDSKIILCGHSHIPRCVELSTGQIVINPGSVGLQAYTDEEPVVHSMQNYSSKASYAILEKNKNNQWNVEFHKVSYDVQSAMKLAKKQSREDWVHCLHTGRYL